MQISHAHLHVIGWLPVQQPRSRHGSIIRWIVYRACGPSHTWAVLRPWRRPDSSRLVRPRCVVVPSCSCRFPASWWTAVPPTYTASPSHPYILWRRSVWESGQATKLLQITPYVNDFHQTLNSPGSRQPIGASKNQFLPSIFESSLSSLMMWNLNEKNVTF